MKSNVWRRQAVTPSFGIRGGGMVWCFYPAQHDKCLRIQRTTCGYFRLTIGDADANTGFDEWWDFFGEDEAFEALKNWPEEPKEVFRCAQCSHLWKAHKKCIDKE